MEEIILDLAGSRGLSQGFAGDQDMVTPRPERITNAQNGEMAGGLFNPHLRVGYMSPISTSSTTVTLDTTPDTKLTSVAYDEKNEQVFFADRGANIYLASSLTDLSLTETISLTDGTITDLAVYDVNEVGHLYYTYHHDHMLMSANAATSTGRSNWHNVAVRIDPAGTTKPAVLYTDDIYDSGTVFTDAIVVPTGTDMAITVICYSISLATVSSMTLGGVALTQVSTDLTVINEAPYRRYVFTGTAVASGTQNLVTTWSTATAFVRHIIISDNTNQTTPVAESNMTTGLTAKPVNKLTTIDNALYIQSVRVSRDSLDLSTISGVTYTYDENIQTGNNGQGLAFDEDGLKMYLVGDTVTIYQYTLTAGFNVSTATYDTKSLDISAHGSIFDFIQISTDGDYLFNKDITGKDLYRWTLSTPGDLSTGTYDSTIDLSSLVEDSSSFFGFTFSSDGTKLYVSYDLSRYEETKRIQQFDLSTPWDLSTLTEGPYFPLSEYTAQSLDLSINDSVMIVGEQNSTTVYLYSMDPLGDGDISKMTYTGESFTAEQNMQSVLGSRGRYVLTRDSSNGDVYSYKTTSSDYPVLSTSSSSKELEKESFLSISRLLTEENPGRQVEVGIAPLKALANNDDDWLTDIQGVDIKTRGEDSFIIPTDNGFAYLFTGNAVHKIDGGITGGQNALVTKNVLLFPYNFTITDALDYRSKLYLALHRYPVDSTSTSLSNYRGKVGILIWSKNSVQLGGTSFIELPGIREIKNIYSSSDGVIKAIVITDGGITEVRKFSYNDSGTVVFTPIKSLGIGAYPQHRDGLTSAGDKTVWIANDGNVYCEKQDTVSIIHQVKAPGATTALKANNIESGIAFYGSGDETASSGYRSNKQGIILSYKDTTLYHKKIYPFDLTLGDNSAQTPNQGDVYTGVKLIPVTSTVKGLRVYNLPIVGSGTDVIATIKVYFNQSTTASKPDGMTKTITKNEAKRGYVDFHINSPYIHAVQLEVEWATGEPLGDDMYIPSVAVLSHEATTTKSPDNG